MMKALMIVAAAAFLTLPATALAQSETDVSEKKTVTREKTKLSYPTYEKDDIVGKAGNFFGQTSAGMAEIVTNLFSQHGEPSAYITGKEVGGAVGVGVTYGSGTLHRPGQEPMEIYWQGPSIGFDAGADASKVFTLVYGLDDVERLFQRFPGGQGNIYFIGGVAAQALSIGDVTVVPMRSGVGARAGVNAGYMSFSKKRHILPF